MKNSLQRAAQYVGWAAAAFMITMGVMIYVLSSGWFLAATGYARSPINLDAFGPVIVLVLGFVVIVAALCGAFRKGQS